jgi:hypothetical protein
MTRHALLSFAFLAGFVALGLVSPPAHGDSSELSADTLNTLDEMGYFTPGFKAAIHDLVDARQALAQAKSEDKKLTLELPDLQKQAAETEAKATALREELARYDHPDETDFLALQTRMHDASSKPEDQLALAQAYVWTYPASPHESEAQQYLHQVQEQEAGRQQAEKDAEAARAAAHAKLIQRAQAHDLSLGEWRDFLRDMSQEDLVRLIGQPNSQSNDYWIYSGEWIIDPTTHKKVGIQINFNGGRVLNVDEVAPSL